MLEAVRRSGQLRFTFNSTLRFEQPGDRPHRQNQPHRLGKSNESVPGVEVCCTGIPLVDQAGTLSCAARKARSSRVLGLGG